MSGFKFVEDPILGKGRAEFISGGTGGESYVAGDGIEINGNTISAIGGGDVTEAEFKDLSDGTQSVSKDLKNARYIIAGWPSPLTNSLTLLHFSDIHADSSALTRIMADRTAFGALVNDVICTGDMVEQSAGQISSWWNPAVLTCIGNHDCYVNGDWNGLSMANRIAYYISPFESNWGITRGENQDWWYKDYTTQKVRLISIDCQWYRNPTGTEATTQTAWVQSLLADAITKGLHVLIASHSRNNLSVRCYGQFSRLGEYTGYDTTVCETPQTIISAVASAISNGLKFIGYITGHYHQDDIWDAAGDGTQYVYAVTLASTASVRNISDQYRVGIDAYNLVTIDTNNTLVKLVRGGGANIDNVGRPRQTITINYSTGEIIDTQRPKDGERLETKDGVQDVKRYLDTKDISGSSVTLQAGYGYKGTATDTLTLETEYVVGNRTGLPSLLDITLSGGTVLPGENVVLADALTDGQRNICSVNFIDGLAIVKVLTVVSNIPPGAYMVSIATGTSDGSLYYGLATSNKSNIYISSSLNGQTLDMGGAVTNGAKVVHGNGYASNTVSGGVSCTSDTTFTTLSMDGVTMLGGVMTMSRVNIPTGGSVIVSGGQMKMSDVEGSGTVDLGSYTGTSYPVIAAEGAIVKNVTITGATNNEAFYVSGVSNIAMSGCVISGNTRTAYTENHWDAAYAQDGGSAYISGCTFANNYVSHTLDAGAGAHTFASANATFDNCTFTSNFASIRAGGYAGNVAGATVRFNSCDFIANSCDGGGLITPSGGYGGCDANVYGNGSAIFSGCNFSSGTGRYGSLVVANGATVEITNCNFTDCVQLYDGPIVIYGGNVSMNGCKISNCSVSSNVVLFHVLSAGTVYISGTTITGNQAGYNDVLIGSGARVIVSDSIISGNVTTYGIGAKQSASITFAGGCTTGRVVPYNTGFVYLAGSNNIQEIYTTTGTNHVYISSGASINLTTSIGVGANGITVSSGGCVVNGASIPAGTYTQIVSSGGSAVAS